jgi:hypothetical protein
MSHFYWTSVDALALSAATAKTALELGTSASNRIRIKEWWVEFDGVSGTAVPVKVEVGRFSAGVTTATSANEKFDPADGTAATTAKHSATVEGAGTADDIQFHRVSPTSGYHYIAPLGQELVLAVSTFWRMRLTAAATVNCTVGVIWEE